MAALQNHMTDLATTLLFYLLTALACGGWGLALAIIFRLPLRGQDKPFALFWLGCAALFLLLQAWHLFLPVDSLASLVLLGGGALIALPRVARCLRRQLPRFGATQWGFALLVLLAAGWVGCYGMLGTFEYDSGGYHFNTIHWLNEFPIVPGIVNLYSHLAFNQTFFLYDALLNWYPYFNKGHNIAASSLYAALLLQCLVAAFYVVRRRRISRSRPLGDLLPILMLPVAALMIVQLHLSSPSPDSASILMQMVIFLALARTVEARGRGTGAASYAALTIFLAATATTVKLSSGAFGVLAVMLAVWSCATGVTGSAAARLRRLLPGLLLAAVAALLWMARGVICSGYPLYPAPIFRFPVEWAASIATAQEDNNWIMSWARQPSAHWSTVLGSWNWLPHWWRSFCEPVTPLAALITDALGGLVLAGTLLFASPFTRRGIARLTVLLLPPIGGLLFWFYMAPDPRFGAGLLWTAGIAAFGIAAVTALRLPKARRANVLLLLFLLLNAWPITWCVWRPAVQGTLMSGYYVVPQDPLQPETSRWGVQVYVPTGEGCLWYGMLPAAPNLNPDLDLRGEGLGSGFVIRKHPEESPAKRE